jgi:hypothetical protein
MGPLKVFFPNLLPSSRNIFQIPYLTGLYSIYDNFNSAVCSPQFLPYERTEEENIENYHFDYENSGLIFWRSGLFTENRGLFVRMSAYLERMVAYYLLIKKIVYLMRIKEYFFLTNLA